MVNDLRARLGRYGYWIGRGKLASDSSELADVGAGLDTLGIPESFKVLVKEMQSLCLNVEVLSSDGTAVEMRDAEEDLFRAA